MEVVPSLVLWRGRRCCWSRLGFAVDDIEEDLKGGRRVIIAVID